MKNALVAALVAAAISATGASAATSDWTAGQLEDLRKANEAAQAQNDNQDAQIELLSRRADRLALKVRTLKRELRNAR